MNKALLMSVMIKHGDTQETLADAMGISLSRLNAKINQRDGADFDRPEIQFILDRYGLDYATGMEIFFTPKVS